MSAHRLTSAPGEDAHRALGTERAVLQVLGGTPVDEAAAARHIEPADLAEAVTVYRRAGRQALERHEAAGWWQAYIQFPDWRTAEQTAANTIIPALRQAEETCLLSNWWFMRKHPCWRLRLQPGTDGQAMRDHLAEEFDQLVATGRITRWWPGIYEAETVAFGSGAGMATAHDLFCADSHAIMRLIAGDAPGLGRRELSLFLCRTLMSAAGLEWYEQGDVWHRVGQERPLPDDVPLAKLGTMAGDLKQLLTADTSPDAPLLTTGPLASTTAWADAFRQAGRALGEASRAGALQRGLRDVLSYQVIFHWNRLGLPARTQGILARAARTAILDLPASTASIRVTDRRPGNTPMSAPSADGGNEGAEERVLARFPLVPQRRFRCPDLETHVRNVRKCAASCHEPCTVEERINRACTVWNLAALITADCGLPDLATDLCHRQFQIFRAAPAITDVAVIPALQPLVNLTRLTRRAGDPAGAYRELEAINHASHNGGDLNLHGVPIAFDGLITELPLTAEAWLRDVMRDDGTRALTAVGRWSDAAAHAEKYDDASTQLREARQTRIIAHALNGQPGAALDLIDNTTTTEQWEHAVTACLRGYVLLKHQSLRTTDVAEIFSTVRRARLATDRPTALFRTRLGLIAVALAVAAGSDARVLCAELANDAERSADAFAARDVQAEPECRTWATREQADALRVRIEQAGLGAGEIAESTLSDLMRSVDLAGLALEKALENLAGTRR